MLLKLLFWLHMCWMSPGSLRSTWDSARMEVHSPRSLSRDSDPLFQRNYLWHIKMAGSQYTDLLSSMPTPSITPFTPLRGANVARTLLEPNECHRETAAPQLHNGLVLKWTNTMCRVIHHFTLTQAAQYIPTLLHASPYGRKNNS